MLRSLLLITILGAAFPSAQASETSNTYRVAVEARDGASTIFASPTATVWAGAAWNMRMEGLEGYELSIQITEVPEGKMKACGTFKSKHGNMAPCLVLNLDQQGTVAVGDLSLAITVSRAGS